MNIPLISGQIAKLHVKLETDDDFELYGGTTKAGFSITPERPEARNEWLVTIDETLVAGKPLTRFDVYVRQMSSGREWVVLSGKILVSPRSAGVDADKLAPIEYNATIPVVENAVDLTGAAIVTGIPGPRGWSAYEIAVQNGFVGSEPEWLEYMRLQTATLAVEQVTPLMERAETAANEAEAAKAEAEKQAENAETYMHTASNKAELAGGHAKAAEASKKAAEGEVSKAAAEVDKATQEKQAAAKSAQDALAKMQGAEQAANDAARAQVAAQNAKTDAEAAKSAAQTAEGNAKGYANAAAADKSDAETARTQAQAAQTKAEQEAAKAEQNAALLGDAALKSKANTFSGANAFNGKTALNGEVSMSFAAADAFWQERNRFIGMTDPQSQIKPLLEAMPTEERIRVSKGIYAGHYDFSSLTNPCGQWGLINSQKLKKCVFNFPAANVKYNRYVFNSFMYLKAPKCESFVMNLPLMEDISLFEYPPNDMGRIERWNTPAAIKVGFGDRIHMTGSISLPKCRYLTHGFNFGAGGGLHKYQTLKISAPKLATVGNNVFSGCILDKASVTTFLNSLPDWSGGCTDTEQGTPRVIGTYGIHIDYQNDEDVLAAIDAATAKGWTIGVQWNGTPTATTFALRPAPQPPVYAKECTATDGLGNEHRSLEWCHQITSPDGKEPEELGYTLFESVEAARAHFNLPEPEEILTAE